ncbi:hypothetical protein PspLS_00287 [Pyricularia sp. CBS 133598]|nr:hypothetical protein PspLS_00287 [Pyricularia sp. CBS 133598]
MRSDNFINTAALALAFFGGAIANPTKSAAGSSVSGKEKPAHSLDECLITLVDGGKTPLAFKTCEAWKFADMTIDEERSRILQLSSDDTSTMSFDREER